LLLELDLENFILFEKASISFSKGLTILTGETGAGKSLLVDALKLVLGARADLQQIRIGAKQAMVQAVFDVLPEIRCQLDDMGIPCNDELVIRRIVPRSGRGRIYVNGAIVSLQDLKQFASGLVSLAGQHEYQELLRRDRHGPWLDRYAVLEKKLRQMADLYHEVRRMQKEVECAMAEKEKTAEKVERLQQEAQEIDRVAPRPGEEEKLEQRLKVLKAAETLRTLGDACYRTLYAEKGSVQEKLAGCKKDLERMAGLDPDLEATLKEFNSVTYQAEEVAWTLREYIQRLQGNPTELERIEERIYQLRELKRHFGPGLDDVVVYRETIDRELEDLHRKNDRIEELKTGLKEGKERLMAHATAISEKRSRAAKELSAAIKAELSDLKLAKTDFVVDVRPTATDIGPTGLDRVEFLFRPNIGQPLRGLAAIASGGELSRVMLALRTALAKKAGVETIVFDEIDAGIGGEVADRVGDKLKALSAFGQIISITHFPQIAARGNRHIVVKKVVKGDNTVTFVRELEQGQRLEELARMLGGDQEAARVYAERLPGLEIQ